MKHRDSYKTKNELKKMVDDLSSMLELRTKILKIAINDNEINYKEENIETYFHLKKVKRALYISKTNYSKIFDDYKKKYFMFVPTYFDVEYFDLEKGK